MYYCDEHGLTDEMEERLQREYWNERCESRDRLISKLDWDECRDSHERAHYIAILLRDYNHVYKKLLH